MMIPLGQTGYLNRVSMHSRICKQHCTQWLVAQVGQPSDRAFQGFVRDYGSRKNPGLSITQQANLPDQGIGFTSHTENT